MNINEEQKYYVELRNRIKKTIDEMYTNIFNCEDSIEGLLHIAPTIFTHAEFLLLLTDYKNLQQRISVFEHMATEINSQPDDMTISVDLAIKFDNAISALNLMFVLLMEYIDEANMSIETDKFDMNKVMVLQRIDNTTHLEYDTVNWVELDECMDKMFIVVGIKDMYDKDFDSDYGVLNVLSIKGFNTKVEANMYALQHGISRDYILRRI